MGEAARRRDRIDSAPRFTVADARHLNARFRDHDTVAMLAAVLSERLAGNVVLVSSFGTESAVLIDLVTMADPTVPVLFLNTHKHFAETLRYRDQLTARLGLNLIIVEPDVGMLAARDTSGLRWSYDPDGCCDLRKVQPLAHALQGFDASITGRKGFQAATRAGLPRFEIDTTDAAGRLKLNPLASWTRADIDAWFVDRDLPRHPLEADGFPSIGCSPCTQRVAPGEDPRAGRWRGFDKTECGIHHAMPAGDFDPGL